MVQEGAIRTGRPSREGSEDSKIGEDKKKGTFTITRLNAISVGVTEVIAIDAIEGEAIEETIEDAETEEGVSVCRTVKFIEHYHLDNQDIRHLTRL